MPKYAEDPAESFIEEVNSLILGAANTADPLGHLIWSTMLIAKAGRDFYRALAVQRMGMH